MEIWSLLFLFCAVCFVWYRNTKTEAAVQKLQGKITLLETELHELQQGKRPKQTAPPAAGPKEEIKVMQPEKIAPAQPAADTQKSPTAASREKTTTAVTSVPTRPARKKQEPSHEYAIDLFFQKIENYFAEYWTGILGSVIMVMGIGFLGIYAALKLSPMLRCGMLVMVAAILFGVAAFLRKKPQWELLASWLRSSSGAVLLFAALGSGMVPGLQWIHNEHLALTLLVLGIVINLYFAIADGRQSFASVHVVISMAALAVVPHSPATLIVAAIITITGVLQTYRVKWEFHLLVTISSFFLFHLYWNFRVIIPALSSLDLDLLQDISSGLVTVIKSNISEAHRLTGIITTGLVGVTALLVHYRKLYHTKTFLPLSLLIHLVNWFFMCSMFLMYSQGSRWNTIILFLAAGATFVLARKARLAGNRWLHTCDTLVGQALMLFALYTSGRWGATPLFITAMIFVETSIFALVVARENEHILTIIATGLQHLALLTTCVTALAGEHFARGAVNYTDAGIMLAICLLEAGYHLYTSITMTEAYDSYRRYIPTLTGSDLSLSGAGTALPLLTAYSMLYQAFYASFIIAGIILILLYLHHRFQTNGLFFSTIFTLISTHLIAWFHAASSYGNTETERILYVAPFLVPALISTGTLYLKTKKITVSWPGIYLSSLSLALMSYWTFNHISPLITGNIWLIFSVLFLEGSLFLSRKFAKKMLQWGKADSHLLYAGYGFFWLFIIRHLAVHLQTETYIGFIPVRIMIELFALAIICYWALATPPQQEKTTFFWQNLHPLFWETSILFAILSCSLEINTAWLPVVWSLSALFLFWCGTHFSGSLSRLQLYAILMNWVAAFHVAFISTSFVTPSTHLLDQSWVGGLISLIFQFLFVLLFYKKAEIAHTAFPPLFSGMGKLSSAIALQTHRWVYYPLFTAVALFLYWSFSHAVLTLLWVVEAFAIFILSVVLKDYQFRYIALGALGLCIVRLLLFDLAQTGTLTRAVVFLGVGIIMLLVNTLYNRYKDRF